MATFNPYNRAIKESINVDFKDRHSPQKVILCNRENQFYGEFIGTIKSDNVDIIGGKITDIALSNVSIYDSTGKLWHLSSLSQQLGEIKASLDIINEDTIPALYLEISANSKNIAELSVALNNIDVSGLTANIYSELNAEKLERGKVDDFLNKKIDSVYSNLSGVDNKLSSKLINHISHQKNDLSALSTDILNRFNILKHYSIIYPSQTGEQYQKGYQLSDYSSNIIEEEIPYGYVNIHTNSIDSVEADKTIGKIRGVQFEDGNVKKFTFVVFDGCPYPELKPGQYEFSTSSYVKETGYLNYELKWDGVPYDPFRMILQGTQTLKYLQATTVDADGATKQVGRIVDFLSDDTIDNIISGVIKFETSLTETLSGFNNIVFRFNGNGDSEIFRCDDGIQRKVIFDQAGKKFTLRDNYYVEFYQSLKNPEEFARIYEGDVTYVSSELDSVNIRLSADVQGSVICDTFTLNTGNSFKTFIDQNFNYLEFDGTNLSINHQSITYKATLKDFDSSNGIVVNKVVGDITFGVENITDISDKRISSFNLSITNGVLSGDYQLKQSELEESKNIYACNKKLSGENYLRFEYDSNYGRNLIKFIHKTDKTVIGYFFIDMSTIRSAKDETYTIYQTQVRKDETGKIVFPEEDTKYTIDYEVSYSTDIETQDGQKSYVLKSSTGNPELNITIPNNTAGGRAREFIVVLITQSPYKDKFTKINILHEDDYQFFMDGFDVTNGLFIVRDTSVLKFTEVNTNKFVIEDMNNANLMHYINERLRGGVNYHGLVQVVFQEDGRTEHLSNLFYFPSTMIPSGWNYPRPEYNNSSLQLFNGNLFCVGKTTGTTTTRWVIDGLELEYGDYIIINKDGVKIQDITSSDIDVIDTIEKDKIIVDDIEVKTLAVNNVSSDSIQNTGDIKSSTISATSIDSDKANFKDTEIDYLNFISANGTELTSTSATITSLASDSAHIIGLSADDVSIKGMLDVDSEVVNSLSTNVQTVTTLCASSEIATNLSVDTLKFGSADGISLNATSASVDTLTTEIGYAKSLTAENETVESLSVKTENVDYISAIEAKVSTLTATNEVAKTIVAYEETVENLSVDNETVSNITAINENVETISAEHALVGSLSGENGTIAHLSSTELNFNDGYGKNLSSNSISATKITTVALSSEYVGSDVGSFSTLSGVNTYVQNETVYGLSVLSGEYAKNIDADEISAKTISVDEFSSESAIIDVLSVSTETVSSLTGESISAKAISSDLDKVTLVNGSEVSTALEISVNLQNQITNNATNISVLSNSLDELKYDQENLEFRYEKTFLSSDVAQDYPNYLVLRDLVKPQNVYILTIRDGMLATKLIKTIQ